MIKLTRTGLKQPANTHSRNRKLTTKLKLQHTEQWRTGQIKDKVQYVLVREALDHPWTKASAAGFLLTLSKFSHDNEKQREFMWILPSRYTCDTIKTWFYRYRWCYPVICRQIRYNMVRKWGYQGVLRGLNLVQYPSVAPSVAKAGKALLSCTFHTVKPGARRDKCGSLSARNAFLHS